MIAWRTTRIFLLHLLAMVVLVMTMFGQVAGQQESVVQSTMSVLRPTANPVLQVPKDRPSVFE